MYYSPARGRYFPRAFVVVVVVAVITLFSYFPLNLFYSGVEIRYESEKYGHIFVLRYFFIIILVGTAAEKMSCNKNNNDVNDDRN